MTVSAQTPYSSQAANSVTTSFPFAYKIRSNTDIVVKLVDANGNETAQTLGVDYTVTGVGSPTGGSVVFTSAPATGMTVKTRRVTGLVRSTDYQNNGDLLAAILNGDVDAVWLALQEFVSGTQAPANALTAPLGEVVTTLAAAVARRDRALVFDAVTGQPGMSTFTATQVASVVAAIYAAAAGPLDALSFLQGGTGAISRTGQDKMRERLSVLDFAANGVSGAAVDPTGAVDSTLGIQAAFTRAGSLGGAEVRVPAGTYKVTAALVPANNTTIVLEAGATIQMATLDASVINAANKTNVQVYGPGKLQTTGTTGTASYVGLVNFDGATGCLAYGVEIQGNQWAGVFMRNATNCHAVRNYVHDSLAAVQDSAGVVIMDNCVDCSASHNRLINTGNHGVLCQGSTAGTVPLRSLIENNVVDGPIAYGIVCYQITTLNQHTLVQGNRVANVTGSYTGGSKGAGIYIQNAGAVRVLGNSVRNVCTATANNTLTPGGIGVNNINAGLVPPMIEGNTIVDVGITAAGVSNPNAITVAGINVSSSTVGANIGPNVYAQGIASSTMTPQYFGVYINASSNVSVGPQRMQIANTLASSQGIFAYANGVSISNITIDGGNIIGCDYAAVRADRSNAAYSITGFSVTGTLISGGSDNVRGLLLNGIVGGAATGVVCSTGTGAALSIATSTQFRVQGGTYTSTGATAVITNGVCTDSVVDESAYIGGLPGSMNNAGTGLRAYVQLAAVPASGTWAVGDHWRTTTPAAATSPGGYCTGAGVPGTWKGEAALAA